MFSFSSALTQAVLIKRYKRFLADVILPSGETITVHCPNTGAMTGCCDPHSIVYLSESDNPKRKYKYTWEYAVDATGNKICVNTNNANKVVKSALQNHHISQVGQYGTIIPEQKYNDSRIDFLLQEDGYPDCYLEVKSATLATNNLGMFPDTVTKRGQKHCYELAQISKQGFQAKLLFCVMRESITQFKIADSIDPDYATSVEYAVAEGVELLCYACELSETNISLSHQIPIII
ncbi:MAG: sugar fermentation stimulation protein A [Alphaproteobacteria bacterium]|jgi:sugar fermentation stimulation protein A